MPRRLAALVGSAASVGASGRPAAPTRSPNAIIPHTSTCPYVVALLAAGEHVLSGDRDADRDACTCLVVAAGCDAMRRLGDALAARFPKKVFTLFVPRTPDPASARSLADDLRRLEEWLTERAPAGPGGAAGDTDAGLPPGADSGGTRAPAERGAGPAAARPAGSPRAVPTDHPDTFSYPTPPRPGGAFVVAGPLSDDGLLRFIETLGLHISGVESCSGPERSEALAGLGEPGVSLGEVATGILEAVSCPRSSVPVRREYLARRLEASGAVAAIYARLPFCDPSAYDTLGVERLAAQRGLPYLEVEVGFPFEASGPLRVRVEAFLETLLLDAELGGLADLEDLEDLDDLLDLDGLEDA